MKFYVLRAFLVSFCRSVPPEFLRSFFIGEWEEELINTHTRALAFNFSLVPPSYSASSLVKRAGLVWCSKDLPYLKVAEILPVLTLWFDQYVLMEGERGWDSYFSVHIILCISLILDQDEHFDDRQCVHFKWTWTGTRPRTTVRNSYVQVCVVCEYNSWHPWTILFSKICHMLGLSGTSSYAVFVYWCACIFVFVCSAHGDIIFYILDQSSF